MFVDVYGQLIEIAACVLAHGCNRVFPKVLCEFLLPTFKEATVTACGDLRGLVVWPAREVVGAKAGEVVKRRAA